jgi:hypothetical protein
MPMQPVELPVLQVAAAGPVGMSLPMA